MKKERFHDYIAYKIIGLFGSTFKARLMDKLPLYKEALFCNGVQCYISSSKELSRSERKFDPIIYKWLEAFTSGDVFYDIGANIGMFSLTVAKIHSQQVKVYAFEPSFSTYTSLIHNVIANRFGNVIYPFSFALGSFQGMRTFNYTDIVSGASVHTLDTVFNQTGNKFEPAFSQQVISYSLDDLIKNFGFLSPTHIKIDVDGGEREIIKGMKDILRSSTIKSVLVEVTENKKDDDQVKEIFSLFSQAGFEQSRQIVHGGFKTYPLVSDILFTKDWNFSDE